MAEGMAAAVGAVSLADSLLVTGSSFNRRRARLMNKPTRGETSVNLKGPVLYWMSRDQRVQGIIELFYYFLLVLSEGSPTSKKVICF